MSTILRDTELRHYRYLSYHSFVSWCWSNLGQNYRVLVVFCAPDTPDPISFLIGLDSMLGSGRPLSEAGDMAGKDLLI